MIRITLISAVLLAGAPAFADAPAAEPAPAAAVEAHDPKVAAALAEGGSLVGVDVLGMVCDFCAVALEKTFNKREEVAAVAVNLDTKAISVVMRAGADMSDEDIETLVAKSGYKIAAIRRDDKGASDAPSAP